MPKPGGLLYGDFPELDLHWDEGELSEELEKLRDELKNIEIDFDEDSYRREMKELREELEKMKKELRKELDDIYDRLK